MIKKIILIFMAVLTVISLTSCVDNQQKKEEEEFKESLMEYYQNDNFYHDYKTNHYKFRLPNYWKNKYNVVVSTGREDFYEINSYDKDETGLLFSILEYGDDSYKKDLKGKNYTYLCYDKRFELHYVFLLPDEEKYNEEFTEQYQKLRDGVFIAKATFKAEM